MKSPSRFKLWVFYAAFILILIISIAQVETNGDQNLDDASGQLDKSWGLALSILSLLAILFTVYSHVHQGLRNRIVDEKPEAIIIVILLIFSTILVAIVSGPDRGLAVDKNGAVFIGNMYYFAWAAFINGVLILASYIESAYGINVAETMRMRSSSFTYWSALLVSSLIVMGTSADLYNRNCDVKVENKPQPFCSQTVLGVTTGTVGVILSLIIVALKISLGAAPFLVEVGINLLLFILYIVEIAIVTDSGGPGAPLGNLYYFSWISFLLTFGVGKACHEDYVEAQMIVEQQQRTAERHMPTLANVTEDDESQSGMNVEKVDEDDVI